MSHYFVQDLLFTGIFSLLGLLAGRLFVSKSIELTGAWFKLPLWILVSVIICVYTILVFSIINHFQYPVEAKYGTKIIFVIIVVSGLVSFAYHFKTSKKNI